MALKQWQIDDPGKGPIAIIGPFGSIAHVSADEADGFHGTRREALAHARMIQKAPQLLDALQRILAHEGETTTNGIGIESDSDALTLAKANAEVVIAETLGMPVRRSFALAKRPAPGGQTLYVETYDDIGPLRWGPDKAQAARFTEYEAQEMLNKIRTWREPPKDLYILWVG